MGMSEREWWVCVLLSWFLNLDVAIWLGKCRKERHAPALQIHVCSENSGNVYYQRVRKMNHPILQSGTHYEAI